MSKTTEEKQDKFFPEASVAYHKTIPKKILLHQKTTSIDSIKMPKNSTLSTKEKILNRSNHAKKFSLIGLGGTFSSLVFAILRQEAYGIKDRKTRYILGDISAVLTWLLAVVSLISFITTMYFIISVFKRLKNIDEKVNNQDKNVVRNIKISSMITLLVFIVPIILAICFLIWAACCFSVSI